MGDVVFDAPFGRIQEIEATRTEYDTNESCQRGFAEVESVANRKRGQGVNQEESREENVKEMDWSRNEVMIEPRHDGKRRRELETKRDNLSLGEVHEDKVGI